MNRTNTTNENKKKVKNKQKIFFKELTQLNEQTNK